jgi:hypothetical protein
VTQSAWAHLPANQSGRHNANLGASRDRLLRGQTYKNLSTICLIPTRGVIHHRIVQSWMNLMPPMNQKFIRLFIHGHEVGEAYNQAIAGILADPHLSTWPYVLTLEEDNAPPPDGLLKLYEAIQSDKTYGAVGGLYWTKGDGGQPMIYGDPHATPVNFIPQLPQLDTVQPCRGLGMGFTLFRTAMFKDPTVPRPWFKTLQDYREGVGVRSYTQDLYFYERAGEAGYRFACDTRVKVGHLDVVNDVMW